MTEPTLFDNRDRVLPPAEEQRLSRQCEDILAALADALACRAYNDTVRIPAEAPGFFWRAALAHAQAELERRTLATGVTVIKDGDRVAQVEIGVEAQDVEWQKRWESQGSTMIPCVPVLIVAAKEPSE